MKKYLLLLIVCFTNRMAFSQNVAINSTGTAPDASAMLDVQSTTKGLLAPKMTLAQRNAISNPATGLLIYQTDGTTGFYYNSGTTVSAIWTTLTTPPSGNNWALTGNSGTNPATNFIGTTDNQPFRLRLNNKWAGELNESTKNYFIGDSAGVFTTSGIKNTSLGSRTLYGNTTGNWNTAMGTEALFSNTAGQYNTAIGSQTLYSNNADGNTANGYQALYSNNLGTYNVANGVQALYYNSSGSNNAANGFKALFSNTSASDNTANGYQALYNNTIGYNNTANGSEALYNNTTGRVNTANGPQALYKNTIGSGNIANGAAALYQNTIGFENTAIGLDALFQNIGGSYNVAIGSGSGNVGPNLNNTVGIGNNGYLPGASNQVIIGNGSTSFIGGAVGFTNQSDARIKNTILEDVKGLDFILHLRPVTYHVSIKAITAITGNKETPDFPEKYEREKVKYTGFIAQEVEQAAKTAGYDFSGVYVPKKTTELYGLRYSEFVVPLVKAVQEQQQIIDGQQKQINDLKDQNKKILAAIDQLIQSKNQ